MNTLLENAAPIIGGIAALAALGLGVRALRGPKPKDGSRLK